MASFQEFMIYFFVSIVQLVGMLDRDSAKTLVGASEFGHHISRESEEWDDNEFNPPLHHAKRSKDVHFTGTCSLNYSKIIRMHRMKKTKYRIDLRRIHLLYTPNRRRRGNDAHPQSIITAPGHSNDALCVCRGPMVKSKPGGHMGGRGFVCDVNFGIRDTRGVDIRRTGWGDGVDHGGVFVFFYVSNFFSG